MSTSSTVAFYKGYYSGGKPVVLSANPFDVAQDLSTGNLWQYTGAAWVAPSWQTSITFWLGAGDSVCARLNSADTRIPDTIQVYYGTDDQVPAELALSSDDVAIHHGIGNYNLAVNVLRQDVTTDTVVDVPFPEGYIISTDDGNWTILKNFTKCVGYDYATISLAWTTTADGTGPQSVDYVTSAEAEDIADVVVSGALLDYPTSETVEQMVSGATISGAIISGAEIDTTVGDYHLTYTSSGGLLVSGGGVALQVSSGGIVVSTSEGEDFGNNAMLQVSGGNILVSHYNGVSGDSATLAVSGDDGGNVAIIATGASGEGMVLGGGTAKLVNTYDEIQQYVAVHSDGIDIQVSDPGRNVNIECHPGSVFVNSRPVLVDSDLAPYPASESIVPIISSAGYTTSSAVEEMISSSTPKLTSEYIDSDSFVSATIPYLSGGVLYRIAKPINTLDITEIESSLNAATVVFDVLEGTPNITLPVTVDTIGDWDVTQDGGSSFVIAAFANMAAVAPRKIGSTTDLPVADGQGVWLYNADTLVSSSYTIKSVNVSSAYVYPDGVYMSATVDSAIVSGGNTYKVNTSNLVIYDGEVFGGSHSSATVRGGTIDSAQRVGLVSVYDGGVVRESPIRDSATVYSGGIISGGDIGNVRGKALTISAGGVADGVLITGDFDEYVDVDVSSGGLLANCIVSPEDGNDESAHVTVYPKGSATAITFSGNGQQDILEIKSAGVVNGGQIYDAKVIVSSTAIISGLSVYGSNASVFVSPVGSMIDTTVLSGAKVSAANPRIGGANNHWDSDTLNMAPTAYANGAIYNFSTTQAVYFTNNAVLSGGTCNGWFYLQTGAEANDVVCLTGGNRSAGFGVLNEGWLRNYRAEGDSAYLYIQSRDALPIIGGTNTYIPGGRVKFSGVGAAYPVEPSVVFDDGTVYNLTMANTSSQFKKLALYDGLLAEHPQISSGCSLNLRYGGQARDVIVESGGSFQMFDTLGTPDSKRVENIISAERIENSNGFVLMRGTNAVASDYTQYAGVGYVQNGARLYNAVISAGTFTVNGNEINTALIDMGSTAYVSGLTVMPGAKLVVSGKADIEAMTVASGQAISKTGVDVELTNMVTAPGASVELTGDGKKVPSSGAKIAGYAANIASGTLYYSGTALGAEVIHGMVTDLGYDGVYYRIQLGSGLTVDSPIVSSGCRIYAQDGCTVQGGTILTSGNIGLLNGAVGYNVYVGEFGGQHSAVTYNIFESSVANDTMVYAGGTLRARPYGSALNANIFSGGTGRIDSDGRMEQIYIESCGQVQVSSGGVLNDSFLQHCGLLIVYSGGSAAVSILEDPGDILVSSGLTAEELASAQPDPEHTQILIESGGIVTY